MSSELKCQSCTFINVTGSRICDACGRSLNLPSINLNPVQGLECARCTFSNLVVSTICAVCENPLVKARVETHEASVVSVSTQSCQICYASFNDVFQMPGCSHICCKICAKQHFTIKIMECGINTFRCPIDVCTVFDELQNKAEFFKNLTPVLQSILDEKTSTIFRSKVGILDIMDKPGFLRCSMCNHAFIHPHKSKMVFCPACRESFCRICNKKWTSGHSQAYCTSNENDYKKEECLMFTNATCPQCKYKYFLERGGCMHITCKECSYEYCEFCFKKITGKGKSCDFRNCSKGQSLHGHHPRNCMYYVQEMDHNKLEHLLKKNGIQHIVPTSHSSKSSNCKVKVNVSIGENWIDSECNKPAQAAFNYMCLNHYKWHLGELMKIHQIDPVDVMDNLECSCELKRNNVTVLQVYTSHNSPIEDEHTNNLRSLIRSQIPYEKILQ